LQALTQGLTSIWGEPVTILGRRLNPYCSTFPAEILTCVVPGGGERQVFCKYTIGDDNRDHGHRGGAGYEAKVYGQVLQGLAISVPAFQGSFASRGTGATCLVLEYLASGIRVSKLPVPSAMPAAAAWAGRFHALNEARVRRGDFPFLTQYTTDYYVGWSRRTLRYAGAAVTEHPWLGALCRHYEELIPTLTGRPQTVIHGEYTPHNVLWHDGRIYPTDWESAALAAGEIDLAILIEGWDEETVGLCIQAYQQARWPSAAAAPFQLALGVARLYVAFRWLGARPNWPAEERSHSRFQQLKGLAERTGLLP
jgi:aminoglycoside phosphotransferase (APT) family kinase protein